MSSMCLLIPRKASSWSRTLLTSLTTHLQFRCHQFLTTSCKSGKEFALPSSAWLLSTQLKVSGKTGEKFKETSWELTCPLFTQQITRSGATCPTGSTCKTNNIQLLRCHGAMMMSPPCALDSSLLARNLLSPSRSTLWSQLTPPLAQQLHPMHFQAFSSRSNSQTPALQALAKQILSAKLTQP
jgi:hypothetical protein